MSLLLLALCGCLATMTHLSTADDWCYTGCAHDPDTWDTLPGSVCGGYRQSPINIFTSNAIAEPNLDNFTFTNFADQNALKMLLNNGHTVKGVVADGQLEVSGGGLNGSYDVLQFHLHWGDTEVHPGSEHMLDGHRYPMEMHIVCLKKGLNVSMALMDPEGLAVLGFFIEATETGMQKPWQDLTSYLDSLPSPDSSVNIIHSISISDLLGDVDRSKFYRYMGSLTTPGCQEAVVWTVFQQPIQVHGDLIKLFSTKTSLTNVYRPTQSLAGRHVYASPAASSGQGHPWCYDDHCDFSPAHWNLLAGAFCGGKQQSPVDIVKKDAVEDPAMGEFIFTHFDNRKAMDYIANTGHTVKCVLKEGMEVSGGGLDHAYSVLQFHFHWGDESDDPKGSEHTVDSVRYPMEMHIVTKRRDLTLDEAKTTKGGLAVLGFFIEAGHMEKSGGTESEHGSGTSSTSSTPGYWTKLTSYLDAVAVIGSNASMTVDMSLDDLLEGVDRSAFYRYDGSLTTPTCNEVVIWTVFKQSIKIDKKLLDDFPRVMGYQNVYRSQQPLGKRRIFTRSSSPSSPAPSRTPVLLLLVLLGSLGPLAATV